MYGGKVGECFFSHSSVMNKRRPLLVTIYKHADIIARFYLLQSEMLNMVNKVLLSTFALYVVRS